MGKEPFNRISSIVGIIVVGIGGSGSGSHGIAATEFKMFQMKAIYDEWVYLSPLLVLPFHPNHISFLFFLFSLFLCECRYTHLIICFFENDYQIQKELFGKSFNLHPHSVHRSQNDWKFFIENRIFNQYLKI